MARIVLCLALVGLLAIAWVLTGAWEGSLERLDQRARQALLLKKGIDELDAYCEGLVDRALSGDVAAYGTLAELIMTDTKIAQAAALRAVSGAAERAEAWVPSLVALAGGAEGEPRVAALVALGALGLESDEVVDALATAVSDTDEKVRNAALASIIELASNEALAPTAVDAVIAALNDSSPENRVLAAQAISLLARSAPLLERVVPLLESRLAAQDPRMRMQAAASLGELGDALATDSLSEALLDPDDRVSLAAAYALGRIGAVSTRMDEGLFGAYEAVLSDPQSPLVVRRILENLLEVSSRSPEAHALLARTAAGADPRLRRIAAEVLEGHAKG